MASHRQAIKALMNKRSRENTRRSRATTHANQHETALTGRKQGHGGTVHPNKAYSEDGNRGNPTTQQQIRRANSKVAKGMNTHQLKKATAQAYSNYMQKREINPHQADKLKQKLIADRHQLTQRLLGGKTGEGFNPGLSKKGQHHATRQLLRAKLGDTFNAYYFTKDKKRNQGGGGNGLHQPQGLGEVHPGHPVTGYTGGGPNPPLRRTPPVDSITPPPYTGPQPTGGGLIGPPGRRKRPPY